jgi:IgA Peptidase M64.
MTRPRFAPRLRRGGLLLFVALALASGPSSAIAKGMDLVSDHLAGPPVILHGSGAADTLNVVILGDGFTSDDASIGAYRDAADRLVAELIGTDPFSVLSSALTIYRLDVLSDEPGIDVWEKCGDKFYDLPPPPAGEGPFQSSRSPKNPANILDTHWCAVDVTTNKPSKRFIGSDTAQVATFAQEAGVFPHIKIVLVNDYMFGATTLPDSAGGVMFVSINQNLVNDTNPDTGAVQQPLNPNPFPAVTVHEFGHLTPFNLFDEYVNNPPNLAADLTPAVQAAIEDSKNLTTVLAPLKWQSLLEPGATVPSDCSQPNPPDVGAAAGGYGFATGVFHSHCSPPSADPGSACKMDANFRTPFCIVCRQRVMQGLEPYVPLLNYVPPRSEPSPVRERPEPGQLWVILDELAIKSGASGWYSIEYTISIDGPPRGDRPQVVTGQWPHDRRVFFQRGQTVVIDDLLTAVPGTWLSSSLKLNVDYRLVWRPKVGDSGAGPPTTVAQEHNEVAVPRIQTGIVALNRPTHRMTLGLIAPH